MNKHRSPTESDRERVEEDLRRSEARFRDLFEQAAVGVAQMETSTGRFLRVNQKFCTIVGYSAEELIQRTFQEITHPEDLQEDLDNMEMLKANRIPEFSIEKRYFRKDGSLGWVDLSLSCIGDAGPEPNTHIAVVVDITKRKRAESYLDIAIQIRRMLPSDAAAVSELGIRSKASWGYGPKEMEIFTREIMLSGEDIASCTHASVAVVNGEIVGYFTLLSHQDGTTELEHLFVRPDRFRQGIGSVLLSSALRAASSRGIDYLTVIADPNSTGFYINRGAVAVGEHRSSIKGRTIPVLSMATDKII